MSNKMRRKAAGSGGMTVDIEPANDNPNDGESYEDFMDRCGRGYDDDHCQSKWENKTFIIPVVHKLHATDEAGMEFILSDATPDRYDDVIDPDGWDLRNFSKNPIALFNHNSDFPIGRWEKLGVKDGGLRGHLRMAPEGTSARHDEIRKLIEAGILKAVSVGFRPIESSARPDSKSGGLKYSKSELVETSLVSVPANPNALAVAKALNISSETRGLVFAEHGRKIIEKERTDLVYSKRSTWQGKEVVEKYYPVKF